MTEHHCIVRFNCDTTLYFEFDGKATVTDKHPTLYWAVPTIISPKRKIKREGWVNIYSNERLGTLDIYIYRSLVNAKANATHKVIDTVKIEWEEFE